MLWLVFQASIKSILWTYLTHWKIIWILLLSGAVFCEGQLGWGVWSCRPDIYPYWFSFWFVIVSVNERRVLTCGCGFLYFFLWFRPFFLHVCWHAGMRYMSISDCYTSLMNQPVYFEICCVLYDSLKSVLSDINVAVFAFLLAFTLYILPPFFFKHSCFFILKVNFL